MTVAVVVLFYLLPLAVPSCRLWFGGLGSRFRTRPHPFNKEFQARVCSCGHCLHAHRGTGRGNWQKSFQEFINYPTPPPSLPRPSRDSLCSLVASFSRSGFCYPPSHPWVFVPVCGPGCTHSIKIFHIKQIITNLWDKL